MEEQPKLTETAAQEEQPKLTEIAATILTGLLASGDFTHTVRTGTTVQSEVGKVRSEAVNTAAELAVKLEAALKTIERS
jgi:hypothetical protein